MIKKINVQLAFKKIHKNSTLFGKTIAKFTKSDFYHVEIIINNMWISSDAPMGVTIQELKELKHDHWEYYNFGEVTILEKDYITIMEFINKQRGKKYDYIGIAFSQTIPLTLHSQNKLFCSEFVTKVLQLLLIQEVLDLQPNLVSPAKLAKIFNMEK